MTKFLKMTDGLGNISIQKVEENGKTWSISTDPANSDYQAYLEANSGSSVPNDPVGNK